MIISAAGGLTIVKLPAQDNTFEHRPALHVHKINVTKNMIPDNLAITIVAVTDKFYSIEIDDIRFRSKNIILIEKLYEILLGDLKEKTLEDVLPEIAL